MEPYECVRVIRITAVTSIYRMVPSRLFRWKEFGGASRIYCDRVGCRHLHYRRSLRHRHANRDNLARSHSRSRGGDGGRIVVQQREAHRHRARYPSNCRNRHSHPRSLRDSRGRSCPYERGRIFAPRALGLESSKHDLFSNWRWLRGGKSQHRRAKRFCYGHGRRVAIGPRETLSLRINLARLQQQSTHLRRPLPASRLPQFQNQTLAPRCVESAFRSYARLHARSRSHRAT